MKQYPDKSPRCAYQIVDGEAIVVSSTEGRVDVFNEMGTRIWQLCDGKRSVEEIAKALTEEFSVSQTQAQEDAKSFIEELSKKKMLISK